MSFNTFNVNPISDFDYLNEPFLYPKFMYLGVKNYYKCVRRV